MSIDPGLFRDLQARGIVKQVTDEALAARLAQPITLYAGFDPTADTLHVGSLLPLLTLRRFQRAGHKVIALVGGATGMIGDPSGKSQERSLLDSSTLEKNVAGIGSLMKRLLPEGTLANNFDWFREMDYIRFLRDVGKHFTVNHMLAKESVRARLEDREHGISYTEFSYMLLQAYDFYVLHTQQGCDLQIGGSDQWGNITAGGELIRRMQAARHAVTRPVYGMTHPLVSKADGTKFGKTESGTIWLSPSRTSAFAFYQFWIQTADADAGTYLRYFSFKSLAEIEALEAKIQSAPERRDAQRALAAEMTELVHGKDGFERAQRATQALFGEEIRTLDAATLTDAFQDAPKTRKPLTGLGAASLVDLLAETGLCPSKGIARKDVAAGGIYVNNTRVTDAALTLKHSDLLGGRYTLLRKGKRTTHVIEWV